MHYRITLVHGTGAPGALWTQSGSKLYQQLKRALAVGADSIEIDAFVWSGGNTFDARFAATEQLREQLRNDLVTHPEAARFVIAHSHGGNIAVHAAQREPNAVSGVVCLATPFILAKWRNLGPGGAAASLFMLLFILLLAIAWFVIVRFRAEATSTDTPCGRSKPRG